MNIVIIGEHPGRMSGFGQVTKQVVDFLQEKHNITLITYADLQSAENAHFLPAMNNKYVRRISKGAIHEDYHGAVTLSEYLKTNEVDLILTIGDLWFFCYLKYIKKAYPHIKLYGYAPLDGGSKPFEAMCPSFKTMHSYDELMEPYDQIIAYSKSAANTIGTDKFIYHAIREVRPQKVEIPEFKNKFVIGSVLRSQYRKGLDQFALLLKTIFKMDPTLKDKILLYIHTPKVNKVADDIFTLAHTFGVEENILTADTIFDDIFYDNNKKLDMKNGISKEKLLGIMKNFNVYASTSYAEGFNLPLMEAAIANIPVVYNAHTTMKEVLTKADYGYPIEPITEFISNKDTRLFYMPNVKKMAQKIIDIFYNKVSGQNSKRLRKLLSEENIKKKWLSIIPEENESTKEPQDIIVTPNKTLALLQPNSIEFDTRIQLPIIVNMLNPKYNKVSIVEYNRIEDPKILDYLAVNNVVTMNSNNIQIEYDGKKYDKQIIISDNWKDYLKVPNYLYIVRTLNVKEQPDINKLKLLLGAENIILDTEVDSLPKSSNVIIWTNRTRIDPLVLAIISKNNYKLYSLNTLNEDIEYKRSINLSKELQN